MNDIGEHIKSRRANNKRIVTAVFNAFRNNADSDSRTLTHLMRWQFQSATQRKIAAAIRLVRRNVA